MKIRSAKAAALLGLDAAIIFSVSARMWSAVAGIATLLMITRFLSPAEQGFYYSFASIIALQVFFELGFSSVIIQFVSHEMAAMHWHPAGILEGVSRNKERFLSIARLSLIWYAAIGVLMVAFILPAGLFFFGTESKALVTDWQFAWSLLVVFAAIHISMTSILILIEGSGKVKEVAKIRLLQSIVASIATWGLVASGHGLYALAGAYASQAAVTLLLIIKNYLPFISDILKKKLLIERVRWTTEILPLQWRLALSWMSGYFISQCLVPLTFHYQGAVEAGKIGLALSIATTVSSLALAWMTTKTPSFGRLISEQKYFELDNIYAFAFTRSCQLIGFASICLVVLAALVSIAGYPIASRLPDPLAFAFLLAATIASHVVFCQAFYLRAFKKEPYLALSIFWAILVATSAVLTSKFAGTRAMLGLYMIVNVGIIVPWSWYIYRTKKAQWTTGINVAP